jgi:hypothetical protein
MLAVTLRYFEFAPVNGKEFLVPKEPAKDQYGMGVKPPSEKWIVKMRARRI